MSGITAWHTGVPFSLGDGDQADLTNSFDSERPYLLPGCNLYANRTPTEWFNYQRFTASTYGTVGNLGRNVMRGPGYAETDISVTKNTRINEKVTLQFKAEMFNIFNHPNFGVPDAGIINAGQTPNGYNYNPITQGQRLLRTTP